MSDDNIKDEPLSAVFETLDVTERAHMVQAGQTIIGIENCLAGRGTNVVSEVLNPDSPFCEWQHYPQGDVYDGTSHAQYYYHAHDGGAEEHGHFHTFLRAKGMPPGIRPVDHHGEDTEIWPAGDDALSHLVAIRMDHHGLPTHLFTTNRWVTGETFYPAEAVHRMLGRFTIGHDWPSQATNRWIAAMLILFGPQIEQLLAERDATIRRHRPAHASAGTDVYEDRTLEVTSICPISVAEQLERLGLAE